MKIEKTGEFYRVSAFDNGAGKNSSATWSTTVETSDIDYAYAEAARYSGAGYSTSLEFCAGCYHESKP